MTTAKHLFKRYILPWAAIRPLQPFYGLLHRAALVGMNIGPVGEVATSGEARLARRLLAAAPADAVVFDVGANVGEFSLLCSKVAPHPMRIFAFEPSPTIFKRLEENARQHDGKAKIVLVQRGLSRVKGSAAINVVEGFEGNSSLRSRPHVHLAAATTTEAIELTTLDDFCREHGILHIYFLKIDIEGEEFACLQGGKTMIESQRVDYLQFEFGGCNIQSRVFFRDFWELLESRYRLYRVLQQALCPIRKYHELGEIFSTTNYLAVNKQISTSRYA